MEWRFVFSIALYYLLIGMKIHIFYCIVFIPFYHFFFFVKVLFMTNKCQLKFQQVLDHSQLHQQITTEMLNYVLPNLCQILFLGHCKLLNKTNWSYSTYYFFLCYSTYFFLMLRIIFDAKPETWNKPPNVSAALPAHQ